MQAVSHGTHTLTANLLAGALVQRVMPSAHSLPAHATVVRRAQSLFILGALATVVALPACRPPTATQGGTNRVRFADASGRLAFLRPHADSIAAQAVRRAGEALGIDGVTLTIRPDAARAIAGYGAGGRTFGAGEVELYLDPAYPGLDTLLARRLAWLIAHEMHHAARWRLTGYGRTLLEAMVSEGMADRFAEELYGGALPPWSRAFEESRQVQLIEQARPFFDATNYDHARWFFDADPSLPRWTGYTIGYRLVVDYQARQGAPSAVRMAATPASAFRP